MFNLKYEDNRFDIIWIEGAIFVIGFEKGLRESKRPLRTEGYLVVSELSWLKHDLPKEARAFMKQAYPAIQTIEKNLEVTKNNEYHIISYFVLPSKS